MDLSTDWSVMWHMGGGRNRPPFLWSAQCIVQTFSAGLPEFCLTPTEHLQTISNITFWESYKALLMRLN